MSGVEVGVPPKKKVRRRISVAKFRLLKKDLFVLYHFACTLDKLDLDSKEMLERTYSMAKNIEFILATNKNKVWIVF